MVIEMPRRYTIKELKKLSDYELLYWIVHDRQESITNVYSPLNQRLDELRRKLERKEKLTGELCVQEPQPCSGGCGNKIAGGLYCPECWDKIMRCKVRKLEV